ncbi:MAG: cytidylate kinase-like family protein [candidate division Zixibacteria bacterium]|jgi:cytidylate kinase|nr:cytidylate kinase-like family protein [candidate division Zixibacteria bacterium]
MATAIEIIVDRQIRRWELEKNRPGEKVSLPERPGPIITISRQKGSGGSLAAQKLAELTGFTLIGRDIIDQISLDIGAQKRLVETLDESVRSKFELWVEGLFRRRIIDTSDYLKSLAKIIGAVSHHGKAIIVGRGANFILGKKRGFHVRVVADIEFRVESLMTRLMISKTAALEEISRSDEQRRKFIKSDFGKEIDDPQEYDLVVNSTFLNPEQVAQLILNSYPMKRFEVT